GLVSLTPDLRAVIYVLHHEGLPLKEAAARFLVTVPALVKHEGVALAKLGIKLPARRGERRRQPVRASAAAAAAPAAQGSPGNLPTSGFQDGPNGAESLVVSVVTDPPSAPLPVAAPVDAP